MIDPIRSSEVKKCQKKKMSEDRQGDLDKQEDLTVTQGL